MHPGQGDARAHTRDERGVEHPRLSLTQIYKYLCIRAISFANWYNDTTMFPIGKQHFSTLDLVEFRSICQGKHHHSVEDFLTSYSVPR